MDYNSYSAIVHKVLQQDGATTDFGGNMIYPPNERGAKKWAMSPPIAAKFLNSDGAISNTLAVTGGDGMEVDLSGLIKTYTAGDGLAENDGEFRVVIDGNETRLQIDPTSKGLKIDLTDIKTKLDGIEAGAQVNAVTSVAGKSGEVTLTKADVGISDSEIDFAGTRFYVNLAGQIVAERAGEPVLKLGGAVNVAVGRNTLKAITDGLSNVAVGDNALEGLTTTHLNVGVGRNAGHYCGVGATEMQTTARSVFIGGNTRGASEDGIINTIVIGENAASQGSNSITLGNSSITKLSCQVTAITALSDSRLKEEISPADLSMCLDAVMNLPVSRYKYKNFTSTHVDEHVTGWLADDVSAVFPKSVSVCDKIFPLLDSDGEQLYEEDDVPLKPCT
ncbi:hypothetical protein AGMMS49975_26400 [Clostridia bacterium]|nr:hypothetical protein AGMMS49975_26400 [Clostridia bacterium]